MGMTLLDRSAQGSARREQPVLADEFLERSRPEPRGQGRVGQGRGRALTRSLFFAEQAIHVTSMRRPERSPGESIKYPAPMGDDWRLQAELFDEGAARALTERLEAERLGEGLETSFGDRLAVSVDGPNVFVYAGDREQAEAAATAIRAIAAEHNWDLELELKRWHPTAEDWEDPDVPLPQTDAERSAERAKLIAQEREETAERGYAEYEVRVECPSHRETVALAERLQQEGLPVLRRWRYLLVGAPDEDSARVLAERIRAEAPSDSTITPEVSRRAAYDDDPGRGSFAIFGGLGG